MLRNKEDSPQGGGSSSPSKIFLGVRFVLIGFDNPTQQAKVRSKLINGGGVDVGGYSSRCTHLIVDRIVYDDSECVVARADGKVVVTAPWVDDCLDVGMLVDTSSILYRPVKDLNGIPGSKSLSICLTGYQRQDREDIMRMVGLMGAYFSKPLVANKVTHLICYKHEGEKYELAKKLKKIKLVNHCWLEDCLKAWEILPECSYSKSGYELEIMEAEAKDSEEEAEDRNNEQYKENVAGSPYNLHTVYGMGTKGLEMPVLMNQNEFAKENLAARAEDIVNEKRLVSPAKKARSDHVPELQQGKKSGVAFICQGTGSYEGTNASKKSSELSSNPTTSKGTPQSNAAAPVSLSYSRKTPGRSPLSKVSGMLSSPAVSHGIEQYKATNGFDVSPTKLVQYKDNLDSVENQNLSKDIELHLEGGNTYKLPQKRKASLSSSSSKSPREVSANLEPCGPGSPSMSARTGKLQNGAFQINSSSCYGNGDNFDKNDIQNVASSHYGNLSDGKSISENKLTNPGMHFSMTLSSDGTEFSSDFKMLERSPKISDVELEHSKNTFEANFSGKDLSRVMDFQFDENGGPQEECQSIMASSLKSENCEAGKARSPVDLSVHSGSKNETFARSLPKKTVVKKSLGSKSKLSSARNKQKGSLCFNSKSDVIFPMEESTGQEHGRAVGGKAEIDRPAFDAEPVFKRMVTKTLSSENKVKNVDEAEDEETEAPDEGIGAELENSAREEVVKPIPQENEAIKKKSEVTNSEANETKIVKLTPEKDEGEVVKGGTCKSIATVHGTNADPKQIVGGSKLKKKSRVTHSAANETKSVTVTPEKDELDVVKGDICKSVATVHVTNADSNQIVGRSKIKKKSGVTHSAEKETTSVTMTPEKDEREVGKEDICMSVATVNGTNADPNQIVGGSKIKEKSRVTHSEANETNSVTMTLEKAEREVVKGDTCRNVATVHGTNADSKQIVGSSKIKKKSRVTHIAVNETKNLIVTPEKDEREVVMGDTCKSVATVHGTNADPKRIVRGSRVVKSEPVWFILTGHRLQRKEFQQMIKRLKGRVCRDSHNWSYQATHSIIPDPIKRTEKFFAAAASGRWILKTDYLIASNRAGNFLPEEPYEWFKNGFNEDGAINLEAPRKWRLLREKTGHGAFYGMNIIIYGDCFAPSLDTLKRVVKAGDGAILATSPPYTRFLKSGVDFAVVSPSMPSVDKWVQEFLRHEIPCVVADYLVEYVCKPGCSLERHVLYKTHAWAEKSFANLISRSNEVVEDMIPIKDDERMDLCCKKCGSFDRAEVMLICGDETGSLGCGIGTHIDCCDPPLEAVPDEDWFCPNCREGKNSTYPTKMIKKRSSTKKRK
ncbi:Brct domain [Thalictrum thalictroides]|uniref:Brct domain n=1 Tax=Thalictrum thalictroides TaxID=46969 RepID=A0A7J6UZZ5_THATH|nr:Brct domain [Thalictrum thalictroides]